MILLASFLLLLKESVEAQAAGSNVNQYESCGSNYNQAQIDQCQVSNFLLLKSNKIKDKAKAIGENWSTPICDEDSTCQASASDPCSFQCIKKVNCPYQVVEYCFNGACLGGEPWKKGIARNKILKLPMHLNKRVQTFLVASFLMSIILT